MVEGGSEAVAAVGQINAIPNFRASSMQVARERPSSREASLIRPWWRSRASRIILRSSCSRASLRVFGREPSKAGSKSDHAAGALLGENAGGWRRLPDLRRARKRGRKREKRYGFTALRGVGADLQGGARSET